MMSFLTSLHQNKELALRYSPVVVRTRDAVLASNAL